MGNAERQRCANGPGLVRSVLHPTDFSEASLSALAHALGISLHRETTLTLVHAGADPRDHGTWKKFPSIREVLERWGRLEPGSPRSAVFDQLALRIKKVALPGSNPLSTILRFLEEHASDLIVLATRGANGPNRFLRRSVAEPLAMRSRARTLFVRDGARGFVEPATGEVRLRKILIPVDHEPPGGEAVAFASHLADALATEEAEIVLLHVGDRGRAPEIAIPDGNGLRYRLEVGTGDSVDGILRMADEIEADLIAMVTAGPDGILDALRGTTTLQVVRRAPCPVLAVPAKS